MAAKKKILVVDDEINLCKMVRLNLEATRKYEVKIETEAKEAIATAKAFRPDLIFLDVVMPGMDGGVLCNKIQDDPELKGTPVVFLTAIVSQDEVTNQGNMVGGYQFLAKPVTTEKLVEVIEKNTERKE